MTPTTAKSPTVAALRVATRPVVLRALGLLGLTDVEIARLLKHSRSVISEWVNGTRPIPAVTHDALWYLVGRIIGAPGRDDPRPLPAGVGLARWGDRAPEVQTLLARAVGFALGGALDEAAAELGEQLLDRLGSRAQREQREVLDHLKASIEAELARVRQAHMNLRQEIMTAEVSDAERKRLLQRWGQIEHELGRK